MILLLKRWYMFSHTRQAPHVHAVCAAGRACGWVDNAAHRIDHVPFGAALGADGNKFSARSGGTVRLVGALGEIRVGWSMGRGRSDRYATE